MTLYRGDGEVIRLRKAKRPRFTSHFGRTWDRWPVLIDGTAADVHYDTTWGIWGYVEVAGELRKFRLLALSRELRLNEVLSSVPVKQEEVKP